MIGTRPKFMGSPYYDADTGKLKPGAPADVVREYEEYVAATEAPGGFIPAPPKIEIPRK